jgi:hypothetical protein
MTVKEKKDERPKLVFENGNKNGKLLLVIITSEDFEGRQVRMVFFEENGEIKLKRFEEVGEYVPTDDRDWIPGVLYDPGADQARAIFGKYNPKTKRHG